MGLVARGMEADDRLDRSAITFKRIFDGVGFVTAEINFGGVLGDPTKLALVGGELALDFANTAGARGTDAPIENIDSVADLLAWGAHAGVLDGSAARAPADAGLLGAALSLREAIHRAGAALARRERPAAGDLAEVVSSARLAMAAAPLAPKTRGEGFDFDFRAAPLETALLGPIAWSALGLFRRGGFERLKQCPGHDCGWLFVDRSKNGSRRWCDMATCGNRVKARRARSRAR